MILSWKQAKTAFIASLTILLCLDVNAQTLHDAKVSHVTFNGGADGQVIKFDVPTTVTVNKSTDATSGDDTLDISVDGTVIRLKCGAQVNPTDCILLAGSTGGGDTPPTTPTPPPDGGTPNSTYCEGVNTALVDCDPSVNHDSIYQSSGDYALDEPAGQKLLTVPFTVQASTTAYGAIRYVSNESSSGIAFRTWVSVLPGGAALDGGVSCDITRYPNRPIYWTQNSAQSGCFLGNEERILYMNYQTFKCGTNNAGDYVCNEEYFSQTFDFDAARDVYGS